MNGTQGTGTAAGGRPRNSAGDLTRAAQLRRRADWALPMSERLARLHELCRQMSTVKDSARRS